MKCPECGQEMEKGYINVSGAIRWTELKPLAQFRGTRALEKTLVGGIGALPIIPTNVEGHLCEHCRLFVGHY